MKTALLLFAALYMIQPLKLTASITNWKSFSDKNGLAGNYVFCAAEDTAGNIWFGTGNGLTRLSADRKTWTKYTASNSALYDDAVFSCFRDKDGNMWFGTYGGAAKLSADGLKWTSYSRKNCTIADVIQDDNLIVSQILQSPDGTMLFFVGGSEWKETIDPHDTTKLIVVYDPRGGIAEMSPGGIWKTHHVSSNFLSFRTVEIRGMFYDRDGNLWATSSRGISRTTPSGTGTVYDAADIGVDRDTVEAGCIMQDNEGNMWFSLRYEGLAKFSSGSGKWTLYNAANCGLADDWVTCIMQDRSGNIWFGSETCQGVSRLSANNTWVTFTGSGAYDADAHKYVDPPEVGDYEYPDCLSSTTDAILQDRTGNIWITTHGSGVAEAIYVPLFVNADTLGIESPKGSTVSFTIDSDINWTAKTTAAWLDVSPASGTPGITTVTITANADLGLSYHAEISIEGSDSTVYKVFVEPLAFRAAPDSITLNADAWSYDYIYVNTNSGWEVTYSQLTPWLAMFSDSGITDHRTKLYFTGPDTLMAAAISENASLSSRTVHLKITSGTQSKYIPVTQKALLTVFPHDIIIDTAAGSSGTFTLSIGKKSPEKWSVSADSAWLAVDTTSGSSSSENGSVVIKTAALTGNTGQYGRRASLIVTAGKLSDTVKVIQKGTGSVVAVDKNRESLPAEFELRQNYPNPFNPSTVISYKLPEAAHVTLRVYDILGREVATLVNEFQNAGTYTSTFRTNNSELKTQNSELPTGIYICRLQAGTFGSTIKMLLIK